MATVPHDVFAMMKVAKEKDAVEQLWAIIGSWRAEIGHDPAKKPSAIIWEGNFYSGKSGNNTCASQCSRAKPELGPK